MRRATSLAYTDADEDAERLVSFPDSSAPSAEGDEWVETHAGRQATVQSAADHSVIQDIPDIDGPADDITSGIGSLSLGAKGDKDPEVLDWDDIPDMEEEGLEDGDEATAAPKPAVAPKSTTSNVVDPKSVFFLQYHSTPSIHVISSTTEPAKGNLLQVRTYDVMITYDKYYQTPRVWLIGYDEVCPACFIPFDILLLDSSITTERHPAHTTPDLPRHLRRSCPQNRNHRAFHPLHLYAGSFRSSMQARECHEESD